MVKKQDIGKIQEELDRKKWCEGEITHMDLSGKMLYCNECAFRNGYGYEAFCRLSHEERVINNVCAKAHLRYEEKRNG